MLSAPRVRLESLRHERVHLISCHDCTLRDSRSSNPASHIRCVHFEGAMSTRMSFSPVFLYSSLRMWYIATYSPRRWKLQVWMQHCMSLGEMICPRMVLTGFLFEVRLQVYCKKRTNLWTTREASKVPILKDHHMCEHISQCEKRRNFHGSWSCVSLAHW